MPYFRYKRIDENGRCRYKLKSSICLFGCKSSIVVKALKCQLESGQHASDQQPPWEWHVNVPETLSKEDKPGNAFMIDLKPKQREKNIFSFYELLHVWGYTHKCYKDYTTALLRLRGLLVDKKCKDLDYKDFTIAPEEVDRPIFTFLYFAGGICKGKLSGKWLPSGPSSTNSVLLRQVDLDYFRPIIQQHCPSRT